ncbi:nuclear transport factor 2 family protein [Hyphococcus flavus]|uniref:Nuclear transport factor 2 family protein n=1 Tax=Hyphococcus flavus TaxID=1866326 RepID=A0AAF0CE66_9PROT|nr:nuclear transport factor 2 family protein [Hyphococcus flavus]WDI30806.1 nuclear transport factor 2 family protein [Hyphococcus flavus]
MKMRLLVSVLAFFASVACSSPSDSTQYNPLDREAALEEINAVRAQFEKVIADGDMAALGALVYPSTIMVQPGSADWKAMQENAGGAPFAPGATIKITPLETVIMNAEWAYDYGASVVTYPDPSTGDEIVLRDTYLLILKNEGDGWKPFREVASATPPPGGWPQAE